MVLADIKVLVDGFNFSTVLEDKTLGEDLAGIVAQGISDRSLVQQSGADSAWPDNAEPYKTWKAAKYGAYQPNVRTGQMLSIDSLLGGTVVSTHDVSMRYGTGQPPDRSITGGRFDEKTDGSITDIEKAYFCSQTRPFYELDEKICDYVINRVTDAADEYFARH